jgi:hypothetical protein
MLVLVSKKWLRGCQIDPPTRKNKADQTYRERDLTFICESFYKYHGTFQLETELSPFRIFNDYRQYNTWKSLSCQALLSCSRSRCGNPCWPCPSHRSTGHIVAQSRSPAASRQCPTTRAAQGKGLPWDSVAPADLGTLILGHCVSLHVWLWRSKLGVPVQLAPSLQSSLLLNLHRLSSLLNRPVLRRLLFADLPVPARSRIAGSKHFASTTFNVNVSFSR